MNLPKTIIFTTRRKHHRVPVNELFVVWGHLREDPRMTSHYLVRSPNKRGARNRMGWDHVVDHTQTLLAYLMDYEQDFGVEEAQMELDDLVEGVGKEGGFPYCIEAGT